MACLLPRKKKPLGTGRMPAPVSSAYCVPYVFQFEIDFERYVWDSDHRFSIKDTHGTGLFDVKAKHPTALSLLLEGKSPIAFHTKRVLRDASGNVLVLLKKKILTMHKRWSVYRGEYDNGRNLLFTLSKSAFFQWRSSFDIFLASNQSSMPDFVVKGDYKEYNYDVLFNGTPVAEVRRKIIIGKEREHVVTLYPGVDHAFIASVVALMYQIKRDDECGERYGGDGSSVYSGGSGGSGGGCSGS